MRRIFGANHLLDVQEDDDAGDNPGDEIDNDHDGTEHDNMGGPLARPVDTQEDDLKEDAEDVDDPCHYHWLHHGGLGQTPDHAEMEQQVHKQKTLEKNIIYQSIFVELINLLYLAMLTVQT